jgi:DNA-binding LacI/PurR family transcriptional regulator
LTYHPKESIHSFKQFISDQEVKGEMLYDHKKIAVEPGDLYLLVSDRTLSMLLDQATEKGLEAGRDFGVISYNETPMKRFVKDGITVLSTDFTLMGKRAAEFVLNTQPVQEVVPIRLIERNSF